MKKVNFLLEREIGAETEQGGVGEGRERAEVVDRGKAGFVAAKGVDVLCLCVAEIGVTPEAVDGGGVDGDGTDGGCVGCEMMEEGVQGEFGEGFVG